MKTYHRNSFLLIIALLVCSGCSGRDTSTPAKALIGHWRVIRVENGNSVSTPSEPSDIWFRPDGTYLQSKKPGVYKKWFYRVQKQDANYRTLELWEPINEKEPNGPWKPAMVASFSGDFNEWKYEFSFGTGPPSIITYKYVDSKLSP